MLERKIQKQKH